MNAFGIVKNYYTQKSDLLKKRDEALTPLVEVENSLIQPKVSKLFETHPLPADMALDLANKTTQHMLMLREIALEQLKENQDWQENNQKMIAVNKTFFDEKNKILGTAEKGLEKCLSKPVFNFLKNLRAIKNNFIAAHDTPAGHGLKIALGQE